MGEDVTITVNEYYRLLNARRKLEALENVGVDNWEGYEIAMQQYVEEER